MIVGHIVDAMDYIDNKILFFLDNGTTRIHTSTKILRK
jgi:hypothetical protein